MISSPSSCDGGLGVLQIEAGVNFLGGLVDRVLHFLKVYFADYVETVVGCHRGQYKASCRLLGYAVPVARLEEAVEVGGG